MLIVQGFYSFSLGFFASYTYFSPLSAEQTAAATHIMAPMMKASLSAVMNGDEIAFGKKVDPSRYLIVAVGMEFTNDEGSVRSIVLTGL